MAIRIVTDSSADLPSALAKRHDITVMPCYVIAGDETFKDGVDISEDAFYHRLESMAQPPTTSQPSTADFEAVYRNFIDQGDQVISIHVAAKLSGTMNSANQAKAAIGSQAPVEIIDSNLASIPLGLTVLDAAKAVQDADDFRDVAQKVRASLHLSHGFFALDTLEYLQKGGRIGKAQAFLGSMLSVKPILRILEGEAHPVERTRSRNRAHRRLVELVRELAPIRQMAVIHSTDPAPAETVKNELRDLCPNENVVEARFGPTLGTYLGPNALGIAVTQVGPSRPARPFMSTGD